MKFTKEFKLEWVRVFDALGEADLEHKKPKRSWEDKMATIQRVMGGESIKGWRVLWLDI